jgi:FkbM family methyltransferase
VNAPVTVSVSIDHLRREREPRAWLTAKAGVLARVVSYGARLILIPLSLELLGPERYGLWLTVGSLIAWLGMSDFGFSQGLVNAIAESSGLDDRAAIRRLVSTGFTLFALLSLILTLFVIPASSWRPLERLLGVAGNPALARDAHLLLLICGLFFAASLSLRAVDSVCQGLQEGYLAAGSAIGAAALNLVAVAVLYWRGASLSTFALALFAELVGSQGKVFAFEPLPRNVDLLRRHVEMNGYRNVRIFPCALADFDGEASFDPGPNPSMGRIAPSGPLKVPCARADSLLARGEVEAPDVIKIDVEGAEAAVLRGARRIMERHPVILVATHGEEVHGECLGLLTAASYEVRGSVGGQPEGKSEILAGAAVG